MRVSFAQGFMFFAVGLVLGYAGLQFDRSHEVGTLGPTPTEVLGRVEGREITEADVELLNPSGFMSLRQQMYDLRAQALESAIQEELINLEAEARGVEPAELLRTEVETMVTDPTDEEVEAFYLERRPQGSLEALAPQIRSYLRGQARSSLFIAFVTGLESRYSVSRDLEPLRATVAYDGFPSKGPEGAPVTIVEFSDFQCPYCRSFLAALEEVEEAYGDRVRFVFRQFPLVSIHPQAFDAAEASLCAEEQGMFWEMHDAMFADQRALQIEQLKATARALGLDGPDFDECLDSNRYAEQVAEDLEAGQAAGVRGTPMIFINGRGLSGAQPFQEISDIIDDELRRAGIQ